MVGKKKSRKQTADKRRFGSTSRYWFALGAIISCSVFAGSNEFILSAQEARTPQATVRLASAGNLPVLKFEIPPGKLRSVVAEFERITGLEAQWPVDGISEIESPGVKGILTAEQALQELLIGTGVQHRFQDEHVVLLEISVPETSVEVSGEVIGMSSPKYPTPLVDIPQTITIISKGTMEEQGATSLREVLQNVPGLTIAAGEGGAPAGDNLTLRGFSARNDLFIDGVRDLGPQSRDPFNLEQVEVVKGPASAFTGRGSTGGTINLVSKAPGEEALYLGSANLGTNDLRRGTADVNLPLENFGEHTALRLNLLLHNDNFAGRDVVENSRWGIAPSLAFGIGTSSRLTLSYFHLQQENLSDYGIPWVPATNNVLVEHRDKPAPVPRDTFYGLLSRDSEDLDADLGTVRYERDINDAFSLRSQMRYGYSTRDSFATPPRFASNDSTVINREMRSWFTRDTIWDNQTDLQSRFETGSLKHTLVSGFNLIHENNIRKVRTAPNQQTTLLSPDPTDPFTGTITQSPYVGDVTGKTGALYSFDRVEIGKQWELTGGLRYDYFDVDGVSTTPTPVNRIDRMLGWTAGAIYKPAANGSIYAASGISMNPSLEGLSYSTANTQIEPEKTRTYEIGSKWDLAQNRLLISGAIFRIDKTNARTPGLTPDEPLQVLDGEQRVQGLEFSAAGTIRQEWKLLLSYTHLNSEILKSNTPAEVGQSLQNTPENALTFWTTYRTPWNVTIGGGATFVGQRYGNNINTRSVDEHWTLDAMTSFPILEFMDLQLNLTNLTDKYYFDRLGGGHLIPGPARSVSISLNFTR